jgi:hypothetical protein
MRHSSTVTNSPITTGGRPIPVLAPTRPFLGHNNHYASLVSAESRQHNSEWWGGVVGKDGGGEGLLAGEGQR